MRCLSFIKCNFYLKYVHCFFAVVIQRQENKYKIEHDLANAPGVILLVDVINLVLVVKVRRLLTLVKETFLQNDIEVVAMHDVDAAVIIDIKLPHATRIVEVCMAISSI